MSRHSFLGNSVFQHSAVAVFALVWGVLGRIALDWFLRFAGFNETRESPALTFAIGSIPVWACVAVVLWTPLTSLLRGATVKQALLFGCMVVAAGTIILYVFFVFQMGLPKTGEEVLTTFAFFPIFVFTALLMGGIVAVPLTLGTALFLRGMLRLIQPITGPGVAA